MPGYDDFQFPGEEFDLTTTDTGIAYLTVLFNTAHNGLYPCYQFLVIKWLANIIICADIKAL